MASNEHDSASSPQSNADSAKCPYHEGQNRSADAENPYTHPNRNGPHDTQPNAGDGKAKDEALETYRADAEGH
ncbi:hypothetical protein ACYTTR_18960, partial [Cobetia marina]